MGVKLTCCHSQLLPWRLQHFVNDPILLSTFCIEILVPIEVILHLQTGSAASVQGVFQHCMGNHASHCAIAGKQQRFQWDFRDPLKEDVEAMNATLLIRVIPL